MPSLMDTFIENRWLVQPNHASTLDTVHGGNILKWMDEVGAMSAMRFATENCVTARMDQVNFTNPVNVGDIAVIEAYVYETGRTSIKVRLRAYRENPLSGEHEPTTGSYSVYVAIDADHEPTEVPDLTVESDRGERLRDEALDGDNDE